MEVETVPTRWVAVKTEDNDGNLVSGRVSLTEEEFRKVRVIGTAAINRDLEVHQMMTIGNKEEELYVRTLIRKPDKVHFLI